MPMSICQIDRIGLVFAINKLKAHLMNRKKVSADNPQGVEYPEAVTADGKLVSAFNIDKTDSYWDNVHFYFPGCEGDSEEEMLFIQRKHRNGITKFFRHKPGYIGDRNEPDRYLHNYAELRIKERFDQSEKSNVFLVKYYVIEKCPNIDSCKLKSFSNCKGDAIPVLKEINLRSLYDTCTIEKGADKYIADLLLTNSKDKDIKPLFLEVYVTHKCSEEKIHSGFPIIEIKIDEKEDADNDIIENAGEIVDDYLFMKSDNQVQIPPIVFYGFKREVKFTNYIDYVNFTLIRKDDGYQGDCRLLKCHEVSNYAPENRVIEFSVPHSETKETDIYEVGMSFAQEYGLKVRDCTLCSRYKIPTREHNRIDARSCRLVNVTWSFKDNEGNVKQIPNPYVCWMPPRCNNFDKSKQAAGCRTYYIDKRRTLYNIQTFKDKLHQFWVDDAIAPQKPETPKKLENNSTPTTKKETVNTKPYESGHKLMTAQECFDCPIYRDRCGHCLGSEMKDGRRYVVCDYQRPR